MKKLLILFLVVLTSLGARADRGGYTLRHVSIDAVVHENNVWDITETMHVEFSEPRHGIYRYIPTAFDYHFELPGGGSKKFHYWNKVTDVKVEGHDFDAQGINESQGNDAVIKIGSIVKEVEGLQTYVIRYKLQYLDDRFDGEDFLCHTIWGTGWETVTDTLDFHITFENQLPANIAQEAHFYSGAHGNTGNADSVKWVFEPDGHTLSGHVYGLPAGHGITVSSRLPERFWKTEQKNATLFYIFAALTAVFAGLLLRLIFAPRRKVLDTVAFYPPQGISSAEVGKIIDDRTDPVDLASLIPWLAHRGHIIIGEVPDKKGRGGVYAEQAIIKGKPLPGNAPAYQHEFMYELFGNIKEVKMNELKECNFEKTKNALNKMFVKEKALFAEVKWIRWFLLMMLASIGMFLTAHSYEQFSDWLLGDWILYSVGCLFVLLIQVFQAKKRYTGKNKVSLGCAYIIITPSLIGYTAFVQWGASDLYCAPIVITAYRIVLLGISLFAGRFIVDSDYRVQVMGELLGLKRFIKTAEHERLYMLADEHPQYFYDILPYAMVFGLSDKWADLFKTIPIDDPDWYERSGTERDYSRLGTALFATSFTDKISHSVYKAIYPHGDDSYDSGGGGGSSYSGGGSSYSGGGGGGGGGGSW